MSICFLAVIERFLARHKMPPTVLGQRALGDPNFVRGLKNGRSPRLVTVDRLDAWMTAYTRAKAADRLTMGSAPTVNRRNLMPPTGPAFVVANGDGASP